MLQFDRISLEEHTEQLRAEVREFLTDTKQHFPLPLSDFTTGHTQSLAANWVIKVGSACAGLASTAAEKRLSSSAM